MKELEGWGRGAKKGRRMSQVTALITGGGVGRGAGEVRSRLFPSLSHLSLKPWMQGLSVTRLVPPGA